MGAMIKDTIIKDTIIKDMTTKAMSSKEEISKRDMIKDTEAVTITTMAMEIEVVTLVIRAMDWKRAQRNMRILIMMQNLDQNILEMGILISHRVTILIGQMATILRDQQVMVKNQIKMVRNLNN